MTPSGPDPLLIGLAAGSEQAYSHLYEQFGARLYRFAAGMLGRREDAEDAVQEVFAALVRSQNKLASVANLEAYLFTALRHAVGQSIERRHRDEIQKQAAAELASNSANDNRAKNDTCAERLQQALAQLPADQREVVSLKIAGELTFSQIAAVLAISQNTAASRYRYALDKLRALLKEGA